MEGEARSDSVQTHPGRMNTRDFSFFIFFFGIGSGPEIAAQSQRKNVQYEANINHISKNNIPAAPCFPSLPALSPFLPLAVIAASPGVCSIKHSPLRGTGMYQGKVKSQKRGVSFCKTMQYVEFFFFFFFGCQQETMKRVNRFEGGSGGTCGRTSVCLCVCVSGNWVVRGTVT